MQRQGSAAFASYAEMATDFAKARWPEMGRPIKKGVRLYKEGNNFVVKMYDWYDYDPNEASDRMTPILKVSPKNIVTFLPPLERVLRRANSLVIMFPRVLPIHLARARKGVYRIDHEVRIPMRAHGLWGTYPDYSYLKNAAPEYFKGIKFNLLTGECLNAKPDMVTTELPEQRKVWRSELRRYKRGLKARIKVGALEGFIHEEHAALAVDKGRWRYRRDACPDWTQPKLTNLLIKSMRQEKYPAEVLHAFVRSVYADSPYHTNITEQHVLAAVDKVFKKHSEHLRRKYGVFGKTLHTKS